MADTHFCVVLVAVTVIVSAGHSGQYRRQQNYSPYNSNELAPSLCHALSSKGDYGELVTSLNDASRHEATKQFVVNTTIELYQYLHPCATIAEAALVMFYDVIDIPPDESEYWQSGSVSAANIPLVGRRRQTTSSVHFHGDSEMLRMQLDTIKHSNGVACIQKVIDDFKAIAAETWKLLHPDFKPPATHHVTQAPAGTVCASCEGLACVTGGTASITCSGDKTACFTEVHEIAIGVRNTVRGCASQFECDRVVLVTACSGVEERILPTGTVCKFCCTGAHCNDPPHIIPLTVSTTAHAVTTAKPPATTTTIHTTHTTQTTHTTTTTTTATTPTTTARHDPHIVSCYECSNLDCLLHPVIQECPANKPVCYIRVTESVTLGREQTRGCTDIPECSPLNAVCDTVEERMLPTGTTCTFCCTTDECNRPPILIPTSGRVTSSSNPHATTQAPTTTPKPTITPTTAAHPATALCYDCLGLACLLNPTVHPCPANKPLCSIKVTETTNSARTLLRGCSEIHECSAVVPVCENVETGTLPDGTSCTLCCSADNCNNPPRLIPTIGRVIGTLIPTSAPTTHIVTTRTTHPTTTTKATTTIERTITTPKTATTPLPPVSCTVCSGIMCLISPPEQQCNSGLCMTTVQDSTRGRDIIRGCADQATCDDQYLTRTKHNADCTDVDHNIVHDHDNTCYFCCLGDNCNHPPQVTPPATSLYTSH